MTNRQREEPLPTWRDTWPQTPMKRTNTSRMSRRCRNILSRVLFRTMEYTLCGNMIRVAQGTSIVSLKSKWSKRITHGSLGRRICGITTVRTAFGKRLLMVVNVAILPASFPDPELRHQNLKLRSPNLQSQESEALLCSFPITFTTMAKHSCCWHLAMISRNSLRWLLQSLLC